MEEEKKFGENLKAKVEEQLKTITEQGVQPNNVDYVYKLVDIHKDLANEEYWKNKEESMMYREGYGREQYGREPYGRRRRDSKGRYMEGYGRRRYRGEEMLEDMHENYSNYAEGREEYGRGNYGAKEGTMKSLDYMLQSVTEFLEMLKKDASSQEEMELIQEYTRQISEM